MRVLVGLGLLAAWGLAGQALAAETPTEAPSEAQVRAPDGARYAFVGETKSDAGTYAAIYVTLPVPAAAHGKIEVVVLDVFSSPVQTPKGAGSYSTAVEAFDCDAGAVSVRRGGLFGADGALVDTFSADAPFEAAPAGSMGYATGVIICRADYKGVGAVQGLPAAPADAKTHTPTG